MSQEKSKSCLPVSIWVAVISGIFLILGAFVSNILPKIIFPTKSADMPKPVTLTITADKDIFQPTPIWQFDATFGHAVDTNTGKSLHLDNSCNTSPPVKDCYGSLIELHFDLSQIPHDANILDAYLELHVTNKQGVPILYLSRAMVPWNEKDFLDCGQDNETRRKIDSVTNEPRWNVKDLITKQVSDQINHGICVSMGNEVEWQGPDNIVFINFDSSENGPENAPRLTVTYLP
jgi:hypothetical protein